MNGPNEDRDNLEIPDLDQKSENFGPARTKRSIAYGPQVPGLYFKKTYALYRTKKFVELLEYIYSRDKIIMTFI